MIQQINTVTCDGLDFTGRVHVSDCQRTGPAGADLHGILASATNTGWTITATRFYSPQCGRTIHEPPNPPGT